MNRGTLYRWFKNDAALVSAYNGWQRDVVETARRRILALSELATSVVAQAMLRGDAVTAREVLKSIGAMEREVKPIAVEPERAERWFKVEEAKNEIVLKKRKSKGTRINDDPIMIRVPFELAPLP